MNKSPFIDSMTLTSYDAGHVLTYFEFHTKNILHHLIVFHRSIKALVNVIIINSTHVISCLLCALHFIQIQKCSITVVLAVRPSE